MDTVENTIDLTYLEQTCGGNKLLMAQIVEMFLAKTPARLLELKENIEQGNPEATKANAHKIKTSYNTIGAKEQGNVLEQIELGCSTLEKTEIELLYADIVGSTDLIMRELEQRLVELKQ